MPPPFFVVFCLSLTSSPSLASPPTRLCPPVAVSLLHLGCRYISPFPLGIVGSELWPCGSADGGSRRRGGTRRRWEAALGRWERSKRRWRGKTATGTKEKQEPPPYHTIVATSIPVAPLSLPCGTHLLYEALPPPPPLDVAAFLCRLHLLHELPRSLAYRRRSARGKHLLSASPPPSPPPWMASDGLAIVQDYSSIANMSVGDGANRA